MKKGQAALEYLMTYGWAILIILIVGFALYTLGVFSPGQWTGKRVTGISYFEVIDFKLDFDGNLTLDLGNKYGRAIEINWVEAKIAGTTRTGTPSNNLLAPNEETEAFTMTGFDNQQAGADYDCELRINFNDTESGVVHEDFGNIGGLVEGS
jgi:hypothetical protein